MVTLVVWDWKMLRVFHSETLTNVRYRMVRTVKRWKGIKIKTVCEQATDNYC